MSMRYLSKLRFLDSISGDKFLNYQVLRCQKFSFSTKSSKLRGSEKTQETEKRKPRKANKEIASLFNEITEILGTESLVADRTQARIITPRETQVRDLKKVEVYQDGVRGVCEIAKEGIQCENIKPSVSEDTHLRNDVSPIVNKITEILRAESDGISMERHLENSGFVYNEEIVEKVLKRCFKVRHLAMRFFNWVKLRTGFCHTVKSYNTMIYIAGEAKEFDLVEKLVQEMERSSCEKDAKTWTILIHHYGKAKMIGKALMLFEKMRKSGCEPDGTAYKLIIRVLCDARKPEIAMEFYKEMVQKDLLLDMNMYRLLLNSLSRSGDIAAVRLVADDMMKVSLIPEGKVYSCMLKCFCSYGRIREALELIRELKNKNMSFDPQHFETLIKGLCRADRIADALEIVDIMKKSCPVDGSIYGMIINGYLRMNEISKALDVFESIKVSGHIPTASTYTELMQRLFRLNEYERACKLYEEMLEQGVEPDAVAIMALVAGHVRYHHVSEAWKVFNNMKEKGIRASQKSYLIFIKELCRISRTDEAIKVLIELQNSKVNSTDEIFHVVISSLEKNGELEKLEQVKQIRGSYELCSQEGKSYDLLTSNQSTCEHCNTVDDISKSEFLIQDLDSNQKEPKRVDGHHIVPLSKVYNDYDLREICLLLSSSKDWCSIQEALEKFTVQYTPDLVLEILRRCQQHGCVALRFFSWVGQQSGYSHTTGTFNMAIKIAGCGKDFKQMRNLFYEMRRKGCSVTSDTWTIMIMQYGRAGLTEISLNKFEEMKADGFKPNGSTYKYLIVFLCGRKGRKVDKAIEIFNEMVLAGCVPDKEMVEIYLNCLCEVGKLPDARRCREYLCKVGFATPHSYSFLIRALCRVGRIEEALKLIDEMGAESSTLDRYIYGSIVHGLLRQGQLGEALAKVDTMKQVGIYPTVHVYTSLMVHFFKEKQIGKALDIFKKMREEGCEPTIVTYSALIHGYMEMGMVLDAWNVFHRIKLKGPLPDFKTYSMFTACLCKIGRSEEALQLIYEMLESGIFPSAINFRTVYYGLNREGKRNLARNLMQTKWDMNSKRKFLT